MAKQIKVRFGKGEMVLEKSTKYMGVKENESAATERGLGAPSLLAEATEREIHPCLGGFKVIAAKKEKGKKLDDQLTSMRSLTEVDTGTHVYHLPGSDTPLVPTGSIYIQFTAKTSEERQKAILAELNLELKEDRDDNKLVARVTPASENPLKVAMALAKYTEVKWAEPDMDAPMIPYAYASPTARLMNQMWHLQNNGRVPDNPQVRLKPGADAKVVDAWKLLDGYGNPNIAVAVIDNGFDLAHPDLSTKVVKPWDLWSNSSQLQSGDPTYTHGTPCAGVAIAPPTGGMVGSAPVARFMPISGTGFSIESTEAMFNYCIKNGAHVISCSWGTVENGYQLSPDKVAAIARAAREGRGGLGCVICYASGNEGVDYVNFYGAHPDVICVGASTSDDEHADYSNSGPELTLVAPSNGNWPILSARASWSEGIPGETGAGRWYYGDGVDRGSRYEHFGGTSSATPLVAGICALVLSANPNLTAREVKQILCQTADKIGSPSEYVNGKSLKYGYGRVNAYRAVQEALRRAGKTAPSGTTTPTTPPTGTQTSANTPLSGGFWRLSTRAAANKKGFSIHAGSFNQWSNAQSIGAGLEAKFKQPVFIHVSGSTPTTMMYRILVGQFNTLLDANKVVATLKANGVSGYARDLGALV